MIFQRAMFEIEMQSPLHSKPGNPYREPRFFAPLPCSSFPQKVCDIFAGDRGDTRGTTLSSRRFSLKIPSHSVPSLLLSVKSRLFTGRRGGMPGTYYFSGLCLKLRCKVRSTQNRGTLTGNPVFRNAPLLLLSAKSLRHFCGRPGRHAEDALSSRRFSLKIPLIAFRRSSFSQKSVHFAGELG